MLTTEENFHRHLWGVATNQSGTVTVGNVIYYVLLFLLLFYWLYLCYRWRARRAILFHLNESCRESGHVLTEVFAPETLLPMAGEHGGVNYLVYNTWGARRMKCWFCAACQGRRHPLETCRRCQTCGINLCVVCSSTRHVVGFGGPTVPVLVVATPGQLPPASASAVYVQHQAPPPVASASAAPAQSYYPSSLPPSQAYPAAASNGMEAIPAAQPIYTSSHANPSQYPSSNYTPGTYSYNNASAIVEPTIYPGGSNSNNNNNNTSINNNSNNNNNNGNDSLNRNNGGGAGGYSEFDVIVPQGVYPGMRFQAICNGRTTEVVCPPGHFPGMQLRVRDSSQ